ncbi:MAG: redoxin domain-containing protein [Muribaculaceae bacterium]|nr:redoxin domain-containing protein [Muribaculaceae bacterium]
MKRTSRTFLIAALFVSLLIVSVAYHSGRPSTRVGDRAPALTFDAPPSEALRAMRGKYVLLCFWSSTNAPSREAVGKYTSWVRRQPNSGVGLIAFNLDKSEPLFREIVKRDGLNQQCQFRLSDERTRRLMRDYDLSPGQYGTLLIAPDGRIVAHNPDPAALSTLTAES